MARRNDDIPNADGQAARRRRLTEALRDNLRRRKAQMRARAAAEGAPVDGADALSPDAASDD